MEGCADLLFLSDLVAFFLARSQKNGLEGLRISRRVIPKNGGGQSPSVQALQRAAIAGDQLARIHHRPSAKSQPGELKKSDDAS